MNTGLIQKIIVLFCLFQSCWIIHYISGESEDYFFPCPVIIGDAATITSPDLLGINMEFHESVQSGTYLNIKDTIRNRYSSSSGPFTLEYYLSGDSKSDSDILVGIQNIGNLVPGGQTTQNFSVAIPVSMNPGIYHVYRTLAGNESGASNPEKRIMGTESDIEVTPFVDGGLIGYFESYDKSLNPGDDFRVNTTLIHSNDTSSVLTRISYYLSENGLIDTDLIYLGDSSFITIEPGKELEVNSFLHPPEDIPEGDYYLIASFLPIELSKDNSGYYWVSDTPVKKGTSQPVIIPTPFPSPEPIASEPDVTTAKTDYPDLLYIGDSFQITDSIQNIGGSTAGIVRVEYLLSQNDDGSDGTHLDWWTFHNLKPGEIRSSHITLGVPDHYRTGIFYLTKKITVTSSPAEVNNDNNYWTGNRPVRVEYNPAAGIPDLTHSIARYPCGNPGDEVEITDTIMNIGNACAEDVSVAYYLSPYPDFDPSTATYVGLWEINRICVGEQQVHTTIVSIPSDLSNGEYYWYSVIDPCSFMPYCGDEMQELDKSNNIDIGRLVIGPCVFCDC